jgi:hypothetical protein
VPSHPMHVNWVYRTVLCRAKVLDSTGSSACKRSLKVIISADNNGVDDKYQTDMCSSCTCICA